MTNSVGHAELICVAILRIRSFCSSYPVDADNDQTKSSKTQAEDDAGKNAVAVVAAGPGSPGKNKESRTSKADAAAAQQQTSNSSWYYLEYIGYAKKKMAQLHIVLREDKQDRQPFSCRKCSPASFHLSNFVMQNLQQMCNCSIFFVGYRWRRLFHRRQ